MANAWFRMYAEFANDAKVQMMSEVDQRRLTMLFCLRCSNDNATLHDTEIAFQLRISEAAWNSTKQLFIEKGFIDSENNLLNWDKRQFTSDSSTERSRRHREQKKLAMQQECNVAATPPDTDTDTETEEDICSANRAEPSPPSSRLKNKALKTDATEILDFLNRKTGKNYDPVSTNLDLISSRLKEGATLTQCKQIIALKFRQWHSDEKMKDYLRPKTLFNKTNFWQYKGELLKLEDDQ